MYYLIWGLKFRWMRISGYNYGEEDIVDVINFESIMDIIDVVIMEKKDSRMHA